MTSLSPATARHYTRKSSAALPSPSQLGEIQLLRQVNKSLVNTVTEKINIIKQLTAQLEEAKNNQSQLSRSCLSGIGRHFINNMSFIQSGKLHFLYVINVDNIAN